jgi:hypothetical protein
MAKYLKRSATYDANAPLNADDPLLSDLENEEGGGGAVTDITYAALQTAIAGETLTAGTTYKITDKGDRGLFFTAISTSQLAKEGTRLMLCPAYYGTGANGGNTWIGVWNSTKNPNAGELAVWGGKVWESVTGDIGTAPNERNLDAVNWVEVSKSSFSNGEYVEMVFGVQYDVENDWIEKQWDSYGNVFGVDYATFQYWDGTPGLNYCDVTDWNFAANANGKIMAHNKAMACYNNSITGNIIFNNIPYEIYYCSNAGDIYNNTNNGKITLLRNGGDCIQNKNNGNVTNCSNTGMIGYNDNNGDIRDIGAGNANVIRNRHNGFIATTTTGDISDTTVNK